MKSQSDLMREQIASISLDLPYRVFPWSARYANPILVNKEFVRECFGIVKARTWVEAGCVIALDNLAKPKGQRIVDCLVRHGGRVAKAFGLGGPDEVLGSADLARMDHEEANPPAEG